MTEWIVAMNLWCAALVAIAIALDVLLARRVRPAWRIALYATVALRLALPIDWHGPLAGVVGAPHGERTALVAADPPQLIGATHVAVPGVSPLSNETVASIAAPRWQAADLVAPVWIAVAILLLTLYVVRRRALALRLRACTPARARVVALARGATVYEHDALGPLTFGIVRARIVLPRALVGELSDDELAHVLDHERAHVLRRDGALVGALVIVCIAAWPVLPVWLAAARVRRLIELAADDRALAGAGAAERIAFGHTLLRLAGTSAGTGALALGGYRDLRGRIRALRRRARMPAAIELGTIATAIAVPLACTGEPESAPRCAELKDSAIAAHDRVELGERALAPDALAAYDAFAERCSEHPDHGELLYYRAELRWSVAHALEQSGGDSQAAYAEAHRDFLVALEAGGDRYESDAATAQMLSKRAELGLAPRPIELNDPPTPERPARGKRIDAHARTDYTAEERALLDSYDTFEAHVDDLGNADLQRVLHHRAQLAIDHLRFDEARAPLERLLASDGAESWHVGGAAMLLDVLTVAWQDRTTDESARIDAAVALLRLCDRLPTMQLWQHADAARLQQPVMTLHDGVLWESAERLREQGDPRACGEAFEELARARPDHARHDALLWNGAQCFVDAEEPERARALAQEILEAHPNSVHLVDAQNLIGC